MQKVTHILLLSIATISSSLAQLVWQERDPELSISQHIGDGIRNVPIPPPWYFLKNKYYWNANTGSTTTEAGNNYNVNKGPITNRFSSPDSVSKFNTEPTTTKIVYEPYTTTLKYQSPNAGSYITLPVTTSTERVTYIPYQPPTVTSIAPSTTTISVHPSPNGLYGTDPALTNAHSRPIYTPEYPYVPEISTEIPKLPNSTSVDQTSGAPTSTNSQLVEKEDADLSGIEATTLKVVEEEVKDVVSVIETTLQPLVDATSESQTSPNPLLVFSGPQICKKQNSYYGVGENHSFYVECQDYQPALKLCPDNYNFFSDVQWPEYPCKQTAVAEDQARTQ